MKKIVLIVVFGSFLSACRQKSPDGLTILGLWKLHMMEIKDTQTGQWNEWRQGMTGYLLYEKSGYMSLHLMPKSYPNTNLRFKNFTDTMGIEQLRYISQNYNYTGSYTIDLDSSIVSHKKLSHSNPNEWGEISRRKFSFAKDTLLVVPTEKANAGLRLKFLKQPSQKVVEN